MKLKLGVSSPCQLRFALSFELSDSDWVSTSTIYLLSILLTSAATHSKVYTSVTQNTLLAHPVLENTKFLHHLDLAPYDGFQPKCLDPEMSELINTMCPHLNLDL